MIVSMTGFGSATGDHEGLVCSVEVRSVNNRFLKTLIRLPDNLAAVEPSVERLVRDRIARGSVTVVVNTTTIDPAAAPPINTALLEAYLEPLQQLARRRAAEDARFHPTVDLAQLLLLPGVLEPVRISEDQMEKQSAFLLKLVESALSRHATMRQEEGKHLWRDLATHLAAIRQSLAAIAKQAPLVSRQYHEKLRARVTQIVNDAKLSFGDSDLLKEVALFADRADISEEISRLTGHLGQFEAVAMEEDQAGRKLDFIAQEMLREANTIASKANDGQIARSTVDIKSAIDRVKEQIQNIE